MLITAEGRVVKPGDCADGEVAVVVTDKHSVMTIERQRTKLRHLDATNQYTYSTGREN